MRSTVLTGSALTLLAVLGLTGCAQAEDAARDQIRSSCERAARSVEDSGALGKAGASAIRDELTRNIDEKYRGPIDDVVDQLPAEAAKRGIADGVNEAVPPDQREQWREMAVDVCTDEVASQLGIG